MPWLFHRSEHPPPDPIPLPLNQTETKNPTQCRQNLSALLPCVLSECTLLGVHADEIQPEFA